MDDPQVLAKGKDGQILSSELARVSGSPTDLSKTPAKGNEETSRATPLAKEVSEGLLPRFEHPIDTNAQGCSPVYKEPKKADIVVNQPDSEDELQEVFGAATGTVADEFDSPVVRNSPRKSIMKSPPNKKASSSKRKKK
ncbi:hypothetical protein U1Q18_014561, partial [Sarracenia purpurea var. burkii]